MKLKEQSEFVAIRHARGARVSRMVLCGLVMLVVAALFAAGCSSESGPSLTSDRPSDAPVVEPTTPPPTESVSPPPTAAASQAPAPQPDAASQDDAVAVGDVELPPPIEEAPDTVPPTVHTPTPAEFDDPSISELPEGVEPERLPPIQALPAPTWQPSRILVAKPTVREIVPVYDSPNGNRLSFKDGDLWSYTYRGGSQVLRVIQGNPGDEWIQAELPMRPWENNVRPNGVSGWVRAESFDWHTVNHQIQIDLSDANGNPRVDFWNGDTWVAGTYAIIGKDSTHTPLMDSFLVEKYPSDNEVLGTYVLMLSGFSTVHETFSGGLPRIALHGTHIPERVGEKLSNGCIRIPNNIIELINSQAPLGTRVNIVA